MGGFVKGIGSKDFLVVPHLHHASTVGTLGRLGRVSPADNGRSPSMMAETIGQRGSDAALERWLVWVLHEAHDVAEEDEGVEGSISISPRRVQDHTVSSAITTVLSPPHLDSIEAAHLMEAAQEQV